MKIVEKARKYMQIRLQLMLIFGLHQMKQISKESGGLVIWNKLPPSNWSFNDYNSVQSLENRENVRSEGIERKSFLIKRIDVIFNSKLFLALII